MRREIDWRENLSYVFLEKGYSAPEPSVPKKTVSWILLSKILPKKFYCFVNSKTTPYQAYEISGDLECPLLKNNECEYIKNHQKKGIWTKKSTCRKICVGAEYKLLRPSKTEEWRYDKKFRVKHDLNRMKLSLRKKDHLWLFFSEDLNKQQYADNGTIIIEEYTSKQVMRLFESKADRKKTNQKYKKDSETSDDKEKNIDKLCFTVRVRQYIKDLFHVDYENPMIYNIDKDFLNQIKKELVGNGGNERSFIYYENSKEHEYFFDFKGFRKKLHNRKDTKKREYENVIKNNYNVKEPFGRPFFSKSEFMNYLNRADEELQIRYESRKEFKTDTRSSKALFEERFNILIGLIIIQFFLNEDIIKTLYINPGSAAKDDEELYEENL